MTTTWDPAQYLLYADERERPFGELLARVPLSAPSRVVDLGCGPGTATARLLERWPDATIVGIDSSEAMITRANELADPPRLGFELGDVGRWEPAPASVDLIISNATFQWIPGHAELLASWLDALTPGGVFAFGVPGNFDSPTHVILGELASSPRWRDRLAAARRVAGVADPADYARRLRGAGASVDAWETTYLHVLTGPDPVLEWVRGTALRPFLARLDATEQTEFVEAYGAALRDAYPPEPTGETILAFRRIFVVAQR